MSTDILVFEISGRRCGMRTAHIQEVLRAVTLAQVIAPPGIIEGMLNLRGRAVAVADIRAWFQLPAAPMRHTDHLIVFEAAGRLSAIRADGALELLRLEDDALEDAANVGATLGPIREVAKVASGAILILDPAKLEPAANDFSEQRALLEAE